MIPGARAQWALSEYIINSIMLKQFLENAINILIFQEKNQSEPGI